MQHVLIVHQEVYAAAHDIPRGNLSDLYPRWLGARELLLHHRNPYSVEITREIQTGYYGRALNPRRRYDPQDEQGFAYPVYVVFLLAPTIGLPFWLVQIGARWFLAILTAATVPLWLRALRWRPPASIVVIQMILLVGSFQSIQGIKLQQLSLLVNGLIAASAFCLLDGQITLAGVLLALATIKPQLALPLSAWLLFWAVGNWSARKNFVFGFVGTIIALVAGGELILPGWIRKFGEAIIAYRRYNDGAASILELLFAPLWGKALAVAIVLCLAVVCWRLRHTSNRGAAFTWIMALILATTVVIVPKPAPYNQVLLMAPVLLILEHLHLLWARGFLLRSSLAVAACLVFWPWVVALAITGVSPFLPSAELQRAWAIPIYDSLLIPIAVSGLVAFVGKELSPPQSNRPKNHLSAP